MTSCDKFRSPTQRDVVFTRLFVRDPAPGDFNQIIFQPLTFATSGFSCVGAANGPMSSVIRWIRHS